MKAALVDAYGIARFLPAALLRYKVESIHVRSEFPDIYLSYRPEDFAVDIQHRGDVTATAAALRAQDVDIVVAGCESGVLLADALSFALGSPGNGMTCPGARRNKYEMALAVRRAGLTAAHSFVSSSLEEIAAWALDHGTWPLVLKPVASAGTDNVFICDSIAEVRAAHDHIMASCDRYNRRNEIVLAQQYLAGTEYFINTVSRDGIHHVVEIWRYHKRTIAGRHTMFDYEHPVSPEDPVTQVLARYTLAVLDALEIRNGAAHTEVMLTKEGPVLVESGARLGGSHLPMVVSRCLGTDQVEQLALAIAQPEQITQRRLESYRLLTHLRYVTLLCPRDGVIPSSDKLACIRGLDSFLDIVLTTAIGQPTPRTMDLATSPGYVYLSADDPAQIEADYQRLRAFEECGLYDLPHP